MEIKIRKVAPEIIALLDTISRDKGISREELIRRILKRYSEDRDFETNPLKMVLRKNEELLEDVKVILIKIVSLMEIK